MSDTPVDKLLKMTQKALGNDPSMTLYAAGDPHIASYVPYGIPSGIPELDLHLGGKAGLPAGKIIEYFGWEASGKTAAALHAIREVQQLGGIALFVDSEHSWDDERAENIGIDLGRVQVSSAYTIEAMFNIAEKWLESVHGLGIDCPLLIVFDSITGTTTEHDQQHGMTAEARIGQDARQIRRGVRRIQGFLSKTKATAIFINHAISTAKAFGKQSEAAGGHGIKFMAAVRVQFVAIGNLKDGDTRIGQKILLNVEKLKNARNHIPQVKEIHLIDGQFNQMHSLLEAGQKTNWIYRPKSAKVYTLYKDTEHEIQFQTNEWSDIVAKLGGYAKAYESWREHGKQQGLLRPWGEEC